MFETVALFLIVFGGTAIFQQRGYTYSKNPYIFSISFLIGIILAVIILEPIKLNIIANSAGCLIVLLASVMYFLSSIERGKKFSIHDMFLHQHLPVVHHDLLIPKRSSAVVKWFDILFQDIITVAVALNVMLMTPSLTAAGLLLGAVVFVFHIPAIYLNGKVYGTLFLLLASTLSIGVPFILTSTPFAFHAIFAFHLLMYPAIASVSRIIALHVSAQ